MKKVDKKISSANAKALARLVSANPVLVGCGLAGDVIPGFKKNLVLHSGPPIEFSEMRGIHQSGIVGAILFEGLAKSKDEAIRMIENGEIEFGEANNNNSGGPGAGITSASMAVLIVEEKNSGIRSFAAPVEGECGGGLGGWGVYNEKIHLNLKKISEYYAPLLNDTLLQAGGIAVKPLFALGLTMGDEEHTRQVATDKLLVSQLIEPIAKSSLKEHEQLNLLRWLNSCNRFVHHIGTATAVASLKAISEIEGSSIVTAMCGNGVEFGIKLSSTGEEWHTAPAPTFTGRYFSEEWSDKDAAPWLGDSSNIEAYGLGALAAAAAPELLRERGASCNDAVKQTQSMSEICIGVNPHYPLPLLDGKCAPAGIDPQRVIDSQILPVLHGGILSKANGGQIGVGYAKAPLECFKKAMQAFLKYK